MNTTTEKDIVVGVWPGLIYRDGQAALKFLTEGLGFTLVASYPGAAEGSIAHAELAWPSGGGIMMGSVGAKSVPDEFTALAVVRGLRDEDYGSRGFTVKDPEGNLWSVGTYRGEITT